MQGTDGWSSLALFTLTSSLIHLALIWLGCGRFIYKPHGPFRVPLNVFLSCVISLSLFFLGLVLFGTPSIGAVPAAVLAPAIDDDDNA